MVPITNIGPAIQSHIARGLMLYQGKRDEGVGKAELAHLGWRLPHVDRVLDFNTGRGWT